MMSLSREGVVADEGGVRQMIEWLIKKATKDYAVVSVEFLQLILDELDQQQAEEEE